MSWAYDTIEREWLCGSILAASPDEVVAAFNRCETAFGRDWIDRSRGTLVGAQPTLRVLIMGQRLASLEGLGRPETLIAKLAAGDPAALAELEAIHMPRVSGAEIELFPSVTAKGRAREPDLRARHGQAPWVYVEVTQPDVSEIYARAKAALQRFSVVVGSIATPFDLEVSFLREPSDVDIEFVLGRIVTMWAARSFGSEDLPGGMGRLLLSDAPSGPITPGDYGEDRRPRICQACGRADQGVTTQRAVVRIPHTDERAELFLKRKSAQLPEEGPGLVMVEMENALGGFAAWDPLLRRRFQPTINTRVGGVCLFESHRLPTEAGLAAVTQTKLLLNPYAKNPLPAWIERAVSAAGAAWRASAASSPGPASC
jgi:hypothetical protein